MTITTGFPKESFSIEITKEWDIDGPTYIATVIRRGRGSLPDSAYKEELFTDPSALAEWLEEAADAWL